MIYGDFRVDFKVSGSCEASYPGSSDRSSSWTPLVRTSKRSFCGEVFSDLNEMGGLSTEERRHVDLRRDKVPFSWFSSSFRIDLLAERHGIVEVQAFLVDEVQEALNTARSALRKWEVWEARLLLGVLEAVPRRWLTLSQYRLRKQVQKSVLAWVDGQLSLESVENVELFVGYTVIQGL